MSGPADAAGVLNATGPAVALWRDHVARQNRSPVAVGALPDRRLGVGGMAEVDVSSAFVDPDIGDVLTYTVSSSSPQVVTARTSGSQVTLMGVGEGAAAIRVTATDPGGLSAWQSFNVTVSRSNQAPEAVGTLPNVELPDVDATREVDVSGAFTDPDDDALTYTASSSSPQVVTVSAVGSRVTLTAVGEGAAAIRVTATDPGGLSAGAVVPGAGDRAVHRRPDPAWRDPDQSGSLHGVAGRASTSYGERWGWRGSAGRTPSCGRG